MKTKTLALVFSSVLVLTSAAKADGVLTVYAGGNAGDGRNCAFFEETGGSWYAIPYSDAGFQTEWAIVQEAHISGTNNFYFWGYDTGSNCGTGASGIAILGR